MCVVEAGGITGRHSGDGVVAFFLAENLGSESAAARACIRAARALREATLQFAERSDMAPDELTMRFGVHSGAGLYLGLISTVGRTEVTALGDDVNDAARIEACAAGGRLLASKSHRTSHPRGRRRSRHRSRPNHLHPTQRTHNDNRKGTTRCTRAASTPDIPPRGPTPEIMTTSCPARHPYGTLRPAVHRRRDRSPPHGKVECSAWIDMEVIDLRASPSPHLRRSPA